MPMKARYTVLDGEILAQERSGVKHDYVPDPLGSIVALYDTNQTKTDTFSYWPYGEERSRTGTTETRFSFLGCSQLSKDSASVHYSRRSHYHSRFARWTQPMRSNRVRRPEVYLFSWNRPTARQDTFGIIVNLAQEIMYIATPPWGKAYPSVDEAVIAILEWVYPISNDPSYPAEYGGWIVSVDPWPGYPRGGAGGPIPVYYQPTFPITQYKPATVDTGGPPTSAVAHWHTHPNYMGYNIYELSWFDQHSMQNKNMPYYLGTIDQVIKWPGPWREFPWGTVVCKRPFHWYPNPLPGLPWGPAVNIPEPPPPGYIPPLPR